MIVDGPGQYFEDSDPTLYEDSEDLGIDYYVPSTSVESPSVHTPVCPYCGALCNEKELDILEENTPTYRIFTKQGYCPKCSCMVTFDHQWAVESVISNRVHVKQDYSEAELNWRELR